MPPAGSPAGRSCQRAESIRTMCVSRVMAALFTRMSGLPSSRSTSAKKRLHRGLVADVAPSRPGLSAGAANRGHELRRRRVALAVRDGHRSTTLGEQLGDAAADPARSAGDDCDAAGELETVEGHGPAGWPFDDSRSSAADAEDAGEQRAAAGDAVDEHDRARRIHRLSSRAAAVCADGSTSARPAIGGTLPAAPHRRAAAQAALPDAPNSPSAPLIDVTTGRASPKTCASADASTSSSPRLPFADAYTTSTSAGAQARVVERHASSSAPAGRAGPARR